MRSHHKFTAAITTAILSVSLLTVTIQSAKAASYQVTTLSGQGGAGEFSSPHGLSVGPNGEVYVADMDNFAIKKIAVNGVISVFAKTAAREDGNVDESFCSVFVRNVNEIWASNCVNSKVFRYDQSGKLIRTYEVKTPFTSSCVNCFDWAGGLVVDGLGGIYLSDEYNHVILRIDVNSGQTTVHAGKPGTAGNSDVGMGLLVTPRGLALDSKNNLYIADQGNGAVRKVTPDGKVSTVQSGLQNPIGVAVDSADIVYSASENWSGSVIHKIGFGRIFEELTTKNDPKLIGGVVGQPAFNPNAGFAIDSRSPSPTNNLYLTDAVNHSIKVYSSTGKFVKKFGSEDGFGITAPGSANQIYMWPNHTYPLADGSYLVQDGFSIRHVSESGNILKVTRLERQCQWPSGGAFNVDGTFFCATGNYIEVRFPDGTWSRIGNATAGKSDGNAATARFNRPEGLAVFKGEIYVADLFNGQIRKIKRIDGTKDFQVTTILGTGVWAGGGDVMPRAKANFASPTKLTIDGKGNLYIADGGVNSVYRTSVVQDTDVIRVGRGIGSWPSSLVADGDGTVFVSGWGGRIYRIANNQMTYLTGGGTGNKLGATESALFNNPTGLSIDRQGNLIIADRDNQQIKKIDLGTTPNFLTTTPTSAYSPYLAATNNQSTGLTAENDRNITAKIIAANQTGLISRIYQGANVSIPNRDTSGLTLCNVAHAGTIELAMNSRPIFEGSGCNNKRFLVTYNGFITWPGSGKQTRTIYTSSVGGVFVKINGESVVSKWNENGGSKTWPFDESSVLTLQGGKQYPIEVWYYRNQLSAQDSASLKLYWSAAPNTKAATFPITELYFSPTKSENDEVVEAPGSPSQPAVSINLNFINLKVRVPENATSVILFAPEFGVTKAKPIIGKVKSGLASFEVAVSSKFAGKKGMLQLVSENAAGESEPLKIPVTVPKVATKAAPKAKVVPKPKAAPSQPQVICEKGAQKRPFDGSCPPGWTNA
jgi:sugar lactone lactonase YvrE